MSEHGRALRTAREASGVSLARMAALTHYSKGLLSLLENGHRSVSSAHVAAYERALGVRIDLDGSDVGSADVELISQAADLVTAVGLRHGGLAAAEMAAAQWKWASSLLSRSMSGTVRFALSGESGRLADRYAWSLADSGRPQQATRVYRTALDLASDHRDIRGVVRVNLANHFTNTGAPREALALLEEVTDVPAVLEFTAHAARARAYAALGEWGPTIRHVGLADEAHTRVDAETLPATHRPYLSGHEAHPHRDAGKALHTLAMSGHRKAVPLAVERLEAAVSLFGPDRSRAVNRCRERLTTLAG